MFCKSALEPASIFVFPKNPEMQPQNRLWQGIASCERTPGGRLFSVFYTGATTEENGNFACIVVSDDDGRTWQDPYIVIRHPDYENMRVFDPNLWVDPLGRLWITWAQSHTIFDGRDGVWAVIWDNPDDDLRSVRLSEPRRLANGIMMNKPTVLSDGTWLFPTAVWSCENPPAAEEHPEVAGDRFSNVLATTDGGKTFTMRGRADVPNREFDEHMIVERRDGSLWMIVRCFDGIGQAISYDKGVTWCREGHSGIPNPNSRSFLRRLRSGNLLLVHHVNFDGRNNLTARLSMDDGVSWTPGLLLDERRDVSYPDGTQAEDGSIYIAYDHDRYGEREILMAKFTEQDILAGRIEDPRSRLRILVSQARGKRG